MWGYAASESAVILAVAGKLPSEYAKKVLAYLVRSGYDPSRVRITTIGFIGWAMFCAGSMIRVACHRALGPQFTWELTVKKDHRLITHGPYAVVRHPAYTAIFLAVFGLVIGYVGSGTLARECGWLKTGGGRLLAGSWLGGMLFVPSVLVRRMKQEDEALKKQFGEEWKVYAQQTPYALLPYVY